jgi:PAS domain S-box-containing protein
MKFMPGDRGFHSERENYQRLLRGVLFTVLLACGLTLIAAVFRGAESGPRVLTLLAIAAVASASFVLLKRSIRRATTVLIIGMWVAVSAATIAFAGVHSANLLVYPFLIALAGWVMGEKWLIGITVATILLVLGLGGAEVMGYYSPTARTGAELVAATQIGTLIVISFLTAAAHRSLARQRDRAVELSEEMALHNLALAQRERDLQIIMEHVPAGIASFDAGSRLRQCNTRYAGLFGAEPEKLTGRHIADFMPGESLDFLMPHWQQCLDGTPARYRRINRNPQDGQSSTLDVELEPEIKDGQVIGLFALTIDVTEQVAAEARVRELNDTLERRVEERTAELEETMDNLQRSQEELAQSEARATLSTLVASVSHELNTPIGNSVMAASTLGDHARTFQSIVDTGQLKRSDLTQFLDTLREGTALMQRNLGRAEDLLKNFRQVAADQASEQRRSFDLATVIKEILATLKPSLKRHPHRIVLDIPAGVTLNSLPGPLGQVVINLINNAYLHAFEGRADGVLTISAQAGEADVLLRLSDNGIGISPENLTRLFQPFFSTKIGKGGTGLGMTIVENLVRKSLGGTIKVRSSIGNGAHFEIRIPRLAPAASQ